MPAYYNENDPKVAAWLRELIKCGHIADGEVDERSIVDVRPDELAGFTQCHFFAGIGGWSYALRLAGWPDDRPVWTGSCPCQPFSVIGKHGGAADKRHLWPDFCRLISERHPTVVFGEQVASRAGREWLAGVRTDLEALGYAVGAADLCAASVGAPHRRQRLYWVADSGSERLERLSRDGGHREEQGRVDTQPGGSTAEAGAACRESSSVDALPMLRGDVMHNSRGARSGLRVPPDRRMAGRSIWDGFWACACADGWRRVEPGAFPLAHGVPARVGRLRGYGNAIVAPLAAAFIKAAMA